MNFNTIPEALQDLKQGKIILVTDDPDRENEGDFICAAEFATTNMYLRTLFSLSFLFLTEANISTLF